MATQPNNVKPIIEEMVKLEVLRVTGLNAQAFSGRFNPSTVYQEMVDGSPSVFGKYRELEEKDTAIGSALEDRKILAMARDSNVVSADPNNGQANLFQEETSAFIEAIPQWRWARWEILGATAYGYKVLEILWSIKTEGIRARLIGRPQELFRFGRIYDPQIGELRLSNFPGAEGQITPPAKFLVATYQPRDGDRRGLPLLRRLYWPSWFKRNALRLHLQFLEKGPGTIAVQYQNDADKDKAREVAEAIYSEIAVGVPEGLQVVESLLAQARVRHAEDFKSLFDYFDAEMTRIILGQTMTSRGAEQGAGSRSLGDVHLAVLWERIRNDLADQEEVINDQLILPWGIWRFGPAFVERAFRPYWRADKQPPKDRMAELALLDKARNMGAGVPKQEVYEQSGIRQPDEGEEVLQPSALSGLVPELLPPARGED